ncbi:MAG: hypothetical protein M3Y87_08140 [Myxococcota bacterium]|nr:hypothetical protein [Myxococcota bacterium]
MTRGMTIGVLAMAVAACGGPRAMVRDASSREIAAPSEGNARIVLAVPGAQRDVISVVDERGAYLGQLGGRTWTTFEATPGTHRYYALVGASAFVVGGTVEAGRTYWVVAETAFGRPMQWVADVPSCGEDASARIADARAVEPDPAADRAAIDRQLGDIPQRILEADRELEAMTAERRARRALQPVPLCGTDAPAAGGAEPAAPAAQPAATDTDPTPVAE